MGFYLTYTQVSDLYSRTVAEATEIFTGLRKLNSAVEESIYAFIVADIPERSRVKIYQIDVVMAEWFGPLDISYNFIYRL